MTIHDFSIDIETLSTAKNAVVLSIGAVYVNTIKRHGSIIDFPHEFYKVIRINDQLNHGRHIDYDTLAWWLKRDEKVRNVTFEGMPGAPEAVTLDQALYDLKAWTLYISKGEDRNFWAKGVGFDGAIIESAFTGPGKMLDHPTFPFRGWQEVRTLERLSGVSVQDQNKRDHPYLHQVCEEWKHHALYDARYQGAFVADELMHGFDHV